MAMRVFNDYSMISTDWLLGDVGDIDDYCIEYVHLQDEFDPKKARLFLEYIQLGYTTRQAALEVPMEDAVIRKWQRGGRGAPSSFIEAYTIARKYQADAMADDVIDIADGTDRITSMLKDGQRDAIKNPFAKDLKHVIARHRKKDDLMESMGNRISSRKWYVSKIHPTAYGDRVQLDHTSTDKPVKINHSDLTDEQLKRLIDLDTELNG